MGPDYRMQQEAEEERMAHSIAVLRRIAKGMGTRADARFLAGELGLTHQYMEKDHAENRRNDRI